MRALNSFYTNLLNFDREISKSYKINFATVNLLRRQHRQQIYVNISCMLTVCVTVNKLADCNES